MNAMGMKDFLNIFKEKNPEYVEMEINEEVNNGKLPIQVERMEDFTDSDRIQEKIRNGYLLLVKIKALKEKDLTELKRAVAKIKKTSLAVDGSIAGIGEDWLLLTPSSAKIHKD